MRKQDGIPSVAAAIIKNDQVVWEGYFGQKDPTGTLPDGNTIYVLASISKVITATAAMQLWEQGLLDLDADINQYLDFPLRNPHFPDVPITARILMTHRSGLAWPNGEDPDFYTNYPDDTAPPLGNWLREYLVPDGTNYHAAVWKQVEPGSLVSYSNIGASVVGYLCERISGMDFADYCEQNIFEPLGMTDTHFTNAGVTSTNVAALYTASNRVTPPYSVAFYPATTVHSSIYELGRFAQAYMHDGTLDGFQLLKPETLQETLRLQVDGEGVCMFWWQVHQTWRGHTGGYTGVSSALSIQVEDDLTIIILSNIGGADAVYPGGAIYNAIYQEALTYR
ncbi:MAG: beta-lactamase family protein [Acidobacteria bacterium]|nr:beta-lactamase family protein [Acidobacteriota bacterium]